MHLGIARFETRLRYVPRERQPTVDTDTQRVASDRRM